MSEAAPFTEGLPSNALFIHFHVTPRTASLPVGNGAMFFYQMRKALLYQLGLKKMDRDNAETVATIAAIRHAFNEHRRLLA